MLPEGYMLPKRQTQEFEVFDEGLYNVQISKIVLKKDVPSFNNPEEKYDALTFHFKVLDEGNFKGHLMFKGGVKILMAAGWDGGQASTLYKIYCAANKVKLSDDEAQLITATEINELVGKVLSVLIENKPNSKGIIGSKITNYVSSKLDSNDFVQELNKETTQNSKLNAPVDEVDVSDIPF